MFHLLRVLRERLGAMKTIRLEVMGGELVTLTHSFDCVLEDGQHVAHVRSREYRVEQVPLLAVPLA